MAAFSNQATLTYVGGTALSNVVTGEIVETLSVTKTAAGDTYGTGDTLAYTVALTNSGTVAVSGITVSDDLGTTAFDTGSVTPLTYVEGSLLYYVNGTLQPTPTVASFSPLTVTGLSIPAGGNAVLVYRASPNEFAPPFAGGSILNTATVTGGGLSAPLTAEETVTAREGAALSINKALSPETVLENGTLTYTFVISNSGNTPAIATDNLSVTDTFDPVLSNITVTLNGETLTAGTDYTYDATTGIFTTTEGRITVPAATVTQDPGTGVFTTTPGTATLVISGTV